MVFNLNRIVIGILLISSILISYQFNLDRILFSIIFILILFDLYISKIIQTIEIFIFIILLLISIFFLQFLSVYILLIVSISITTLLISLFVSSNLFKYSFLCSLFFFNLSFYYLMIFDRNIFYFIFLISFINDTTAYLFGNILKGPLIIPKISPKKTWSGTILSIIISSIILLYFKYNIFVSIILSISLFLGDAYFSYIKRSFNKKDFSNLLGKHGGILDRIDSCFILVLILIIYLNL